MTVPTYNVYSDINMKLTPGEYVTDIDSINQSIYNLLTTPKGSRTFLAAYGTNIESILFELDDYVTKDLLYKEIIDAINFWEGRRIRLNTGASTVILDPTNHEFIVTLVFNVIGLDNTVYDFQLGIKP